MASRSSAFLLLACATVLLLAVAVDGVPDKPKTVKCKEKKGFPSCGPLTCPPGCPRSCLADCEFCKPVCTCDRPGGVCQDPRFVGGDGITFYFHGKRDRDFCLLSDYDLHINAHFIGKRDANLTHNFTWVQSAALLFDDHRLFLGAQKTATWDDAVDRLALVLDDTPIAISAHEGASWDSSLPGLSIVRSATTNAVTVQLHGKFKITANVVPITAEESRVHHYGVGADDCFAHLELGFKFYSLTKDVHGVLGQTYREDYVSRVKLSANNPIMSGERMFESSHLYAADCKVARFGSIGGAGIAMVSDEVTCKSEISGRGIVCKK